MVRAAQKFYGSVICIHELKLLRDFRENYVLIIGRDLLRELGLSVSTSSPILLFFFFLELVKP